MSLKRTIPRRATSPDTRRCPTYTTRGTVSRHLAILLRVDRFAGTIAPRTGRWQSRQRQQKPERARKGNMTKTSPTVQEVDASAEAGAEPATLCDEQARQEAHQ